MQDLIGLPTRLWNRRVARLPDEGVLLFGTDLHGNFDDYCRLRELYDEEEAAGNRPFLLLCGDLVHGPDPRMAASWPDYLGTAYPDESVKLVLDYMRFAREGRTACLLGNHEHAHVGGPQLGKFYEDEADVLEQALGEQAADVRRFFSVFPLIAVSKSGACFTHAAPAATEADLESFEMLEYTGYADRDLFSMTRVGTVGALLWARCATAEQSQRFLESVSSDGIRKTFVAFGHDIVREGYELSFGDQLCLSTSFGLFDANKMYLRLDLSTKYPSAQALRVGHEILPLY